MGWYIYKTMGVFLLQGCNSMTQKAPNSTYKSSESYISAHVWVVAIVIISLARRWVLIVFIEAMDFTQIIIEAMVLSKAMVFLTNYL